METTASNFKGSAKEQAQTMAFALAPIRMEQQQQSITLYYCYTIAELGHYWAALWLQIQCAEPAAMLSLRQTKPPFALNLSLLVHTKPFPVRKTAANLSNALMRFRCAASLK